MTSISQPYDEQDSWSEDDGIFDETREDDDLSGIAHSKKIHLNVNPKYGPGWTREHGFRELVQNWYVVFYTEVLMKSWQADVLQGEIAL